jgi:ferritin-like metal-binding protein YciE
MSKILQEMSAVAQNQEVAEAFEARAWVSAKIVSTMDEAFRLIGQKPMDLTGQLEDRFLEDFRKELGEIQSPGARRLFALAKASQLIHLRIGELVALVAAADITGNYGVGVLLESCLADTLAFVERTRRLIRNVAEIKVAGAVA